MDGSLSMAVVIVNHNTCEHLRACLATVAAEAPDEIVVVDNASSDGSVEMVRAEYPQVTLYANSINSGYGAGANQAVASCKSDYVLLLNSDTRLQPEALRVLSTCLAQRPQAAIVGPRLANPDGSLQPSCFPFPTPLNTVLRATSLGAAIGYVPVLRNYYLPTWSHTHERVVPWVLGAALAIRRRAFDAVTGFDESFFMYSEEIDLCYRLNKAGWKIHFIPLTTVIHVGGASTRRYRADMTVQLYRSRVQFYQHHYSKRRLLQLKAFLVYLMLRNTLRDTFRLYGTEEADKRINLLEDIRAWKHVLLGQGWR